ncbi:hypothetical protein ACN28E_42940 [Archangium lansingense]|uniref:hypothetical protein n=1 Tax=Archangium lansingense TaxID=2995310 RepID=UPI003B78ED6E
MPAAQDGEEGGRGHRGAAAQHRGERADDPLQPAGRYSPRHTQGKTEKKFVYVPGRIINLVVG